jgi:TPR repeat protein
MKKILLAVGVWVALSGMAWAGFDEGLAAYEKEDYATALSEWQPLAKQGNAKAQYNLGLMYANGDGVPKNAVQAVRWFRLAADQGDASAQYNLGLMYANGDDVPKNAVQAVRWYRLAADQGNAVAQNNLGLMYDKGDGVPKSAVEAVRWYRLAADQGNAKAQNNLGVMYWLGQGVPKNYVVAYALLNLTSVDFAPAIQGRDALEKMMSVTQIEAGQALSMRLQSSDHFLQTLDEAAR